MSNSHLHYSWIVLSFHNFACEIFIPINSILTIHPIRMTPAMTSDWNTMYGCSAMSQYICDGGGCCRCDQFILRTPYAYVDELRTLAYFFFFCFNLASSISLAWFGTLFYSLSSIIMNVAVFNPQKNVWFVARRTAKSLHTSYIIVGEWKFFMVEKL